MADISWQVVRPVYGDNASQAFGSGGPDDTGSAPTMRSGGADIEQEESLALQGGGEQALDLPIDPRPGAWHNADHAFNETQFKHGHRQSEVEPRDPETSVVQFTNDEDGVVKDSYVFDVDPSNELQVAEVMRNMAGRAYSYKDKGDSQYHLDESAITSFGNPFGGTRERIVNNKKADMDGRPAGGSGEEYGFSSAAASAGMEYFYEQAPPPPVTGPESASINRNKEVGLRRVSIRVNQGTLMERVSERDAGMKASQLYQAKQQEMDNTESLLARTGAMTDEKREEALMELRSYPAGQFTAVQAGLQDLSNMQRNKRGKKRGKDGNFSGGWGGGVVSGL
jgi:hypothetical protein